MLLGWKTRRVHQTSRHAFISYVAKNGWQVECHMTPSPRRAVTCLAEGISDLLLCNYLSFNPHIKYNLNKFLKCCIAQGRMGRTRGKSGNYCCLFAILIRFSRPWYGMRQPHGVDWQSGPTLGEFFLVLYTLQWKCVVRPGSWYN